MRLDQEFLADRVAASRYGETISYASSLVALAQSPREWVANAEVQMPRQSSSISALFQRVLMLVKCPFPVETHPPKWWLLTTIPLLTCLTVLASGLTLQGNPDHRACASPHDANGGHGQIHFQKLAPETDPADERPAKTFNLLDTLPPRFELEGEIWADPNDLPGIAIAGRKLGPVPPLPGSPALVEGYHKLRMVRDQQGISLWLNQQPIPHHPDDAPLPASLSVQLTPNRTIRFRDLRIAW